MKARMPSLLKKARGRAPRSVKILWRLAKSVTTGLSASEKRLGFEDALVNNVLTSLGPDVFFVQIGSNDGTHGDPLNRHIQKGTWRGLLVEPVPYLFERLKATYAHARTRLRFVCAAVGPQNEELDFYYVNEQAGPDLGLPVWYDQVGSFSRGHVINHLGDEIIPYLVSQRIPAITFQDLMVREDVKRLDVLHIDCEGYDYEILTSIDLAFWQPNVIIFEHKHLDADCKAAAVQFLSRHGYACRELYYDMLAHRQPIPKRAELLAKFLVCEP